MELTLFTETRLSDKIAEPSFDTRNFGQPIIVTFPEFTWKTGNVHFNLLDKCFSLRLFGFHYVI